MSEHEFQHGEQQIDVRTLPVQRRHSVVFEAYQQLTVGQSMVVVNDHEPHGLHEEFDREFAGAFSWDVVSAEGVEHRVRITKRAITALPRVVADTTALSEASGADTGDSIWQLTPGARDLDSNIIALPAHDEIGMHKGPNLDVLILVLRGSGALHTELHVIELYPGALLWLPRNAHRRFVAGPEGLEYFTVHQRKPTLNITTAPHTA